MSLDYMLEISTQMDPQAVLAQLLRSIALDTPIIHTNPAKPLSEAVYRAKLTDFDCFAHITREDEQFSEALGILTRVSINLNTGREYRATDLAATRMAIAWLEQTTDDCALMFEGEEVRLYRKEGVLVVNALPDIWIPEHLALLTLPYILKEIPVL